METSLPAVDPVSKRFILERPPVMDTWYSSGVEYVCDTVMLSVVTVVSVLPSPQDIVSVSPECTSTGMAMDSPAEAVSQVVTNASADCANACPGIASGTCCHSGMDGATIQAPVGNVPAPSYSRNATATAARTSSVAAVRSLAPGILLARRARAFGRASGPPAGDGACLDFTAPAPGWQACLQVRGRRQTRLADF